MDYGTHDLAADIQDAFDNSWPNIGAALDDKASTNPDQTGWMYPDAKGIWREMSWSAFRDWTHVLGAGLLALGYRTGDVVGICAGTSIRWIAADMALSVIGATTNSLYPNTRADDINFILRDSGAAAIFVQNEQILEKVTMHQALNEQISRIIVMEGENRSADPRVLTWEELEAHGRRHLKESPVCVRNAMDTTSHDTLATIIYTSGTTGRPKGVEITQGTWIYEAIGWGANNTIQDRDIHFIWLPLSHGFGKCMILISLYTGTINALDGRIDQIVPNMAKVHPTLMCGVPRIFEKVRSGVLNAAPPDSSKGKIVKWAMRVGEQSFPYRSQHLKMPARLAAQYRLADRLVFSTIRRQLGGKLQYVISGSAKLNPELQRWFFNLGIPLLEGYGVTETAAVTFYNRPQDLTFGSVGRIIPGSAVRVDEGTGEILIKGPCVMRGYHNDPELTAQVIRDGWFHTGDIGRVDNDGFLYITDRIKDVIKTSNGKFVSPSEVEAMLTGNSEAISQAVVVGEGHKYCVALVSLDPQWISEWCSAHERAGMPYSEAVRLQEVRRQLQRDIDRANSKLGSWETVKRFEILDAEMTVDDGTATPTLKVRRSHAIEHYQSLIDKMYADEQDVRLS
ncbi:MULTISPECIES: long-chain fatty acid--CoA ligase [unclassified Actinobaculum]|uniref:AMP-dependent synthetase/ligase n=1 Tax=unclassified Actinobaculum TaxID=2609299 RepID=UPI000D525EEF|nr:MULTISPECIES: long-chain fatty acid--CoA ligase [unclassified Actinobaculum]AWE41910.1 long-chain fatty acid--CoA ligase [Actinobaculum sp. 313]RTE50175.1 long-chain fatty acid--CoA ligase [Actinobaculum sp. 352]